MSTQVFRLADSSLVFPVWKSIRECPPNKVADESRISRALAKSNSLTESEVIELLGKLADDGLVLRKTTGKTAEFLLPDCVFADEESDGDQEDMGDLLQLRDSYCYECHTPGEVLMCAQCPRVFHPECVRPDTAIDLPLLPFKEPVPQVIQNTYLQVYGMPYAKPRSHNSTPMSSLSVEMQTKCINCRLSKAKETTALSGESLNFLLDISFTRIRSWISLDTFSEQEAHSIIIPAQYITELSKVLFQHRFTANDIAAKIENDAYESLVEFQCDIMDVLHCIGVLRGVRCAEYEAAKYLLLDALHDIMEIEKCQDCYRHSSIKNDDQWFVKPCQPPHEIVYAKQTGYSYWPAKVIRKMNAFYDVRFFGQHHSRALIPLRNIKTLNDKLPAMKRSVNLTKALDELKQHQDLLGNHEPGQGTVNIETKQREIVTAQRKVPQAKKKPLPKPRKTAAKPTSTVAKTISKNNQDEELQSPDINLFIFDEADVDGPVTSTPHITKKMKTSESPILDLSDNESASSTISDYLGREADEVLVIDKKFDARPVLHRLDESTIYRHNLTLQSTPNGDAADHSPPSLGCPDDAETVINELRQDLHGCPAKYVQIALNALRKELRNKQSMMARHADAVLEAKRMQWCYKCLQPAIYYCCWRISYCSPECQNQHWTEGHKKLCKRPRDKKTEDMDTQTESLE